MTLSSCCRFAEVKMDARQVFKNIIKCVATGEVRFMPLNSDVPFVLMSPFLLPIMRFLCLEEDLSINMRAVKNQLSPLISLWQI